MTITLERIREMGDEASVHIAAGPRYLHTGGVLEPRLWEALRLEMQSRLRLATGEQFAIVHFEMNPITEGR